MLQNRLGIDDPIELARVEEKLGKRKAIAMWERGELNQLQAGTFAALAYVHRTLFEDIYDFATFVLKARNEHPEWMHAIINERQGTFVNRFLNGRLASNREEREKKKMLLTTRRFENETGELVDWEKMRTARA